MRRAMAVRAVGSLAHHLHRSLQGKNAVPTVIADVQSRPTNSTNVVFHFQNYTREPSVFRPAVTHRIPPWQRSAASCNCTLILAEETHHGFSLLPVRCIFEVIKFSYKVQLQIAFNFVRVTLLKAEIRKELSHEQIYGIPWRRS